MRDEHMVICSPAVFELISPDSAPVPVKVELTYDSRDPYAVQASFRTGHGTAVDWVFARDLLADGLMASSGTGDVRVQPMPTDSGRIELELNSPSGHALFTTCAPDPRRVPRPHLRGRAPVDRVLLARLRHGPVGAADQRPRPRLTVAPRPAATCSDGVQGG